MSAGRVLIVCHSPSEATRALAEAVRDGARAAAETVSVSLQSPFDTGPYDVLDSTGIILGTTENFGYMNGALKDFLERIYHPCLDRTAGRPWGLFVKAGNDGTGARDSVTRIVTGLRWRAIGEPVLCVGSPDAPTFERFADLGATMAAGIEAGLW